MRLYSERRMVWRTLLLLLATAWLLTGCGAVMRSATTNLSRDLSKAILNNNDPDTVAEGAPAYLLMVDGLLVKNPDSPSLLMTAADLYSQYASVFVTNSARARILSEKALTYASRALCLREKDACGLRTTNFKTFSATIDRMDKKDVPALYTLGAAWATWIQFRRDDWNAIAEIPRVEAIMRRVLTLDETYKDGAAHMYLGVFDSLIPRTLGGKPEKGRRNFERALQLAGNKNLMIYVLYAKYYARMVLDRKLYDRLLKKALSLNPDVPGYVLMNTVAQKQARALLASADNYF